MAVALEFINVIVRIDAIREKCRGGWEQFLVDREKEIGSVAWYDDHLYRDGAMNPFGAESLVSYLIEKGLTGYREADGKPVEWVDFCVTELFGATLICDWVAFTDYGSAAYLKGTEPGKTMTRNDFPEFDWATWYRNS